ncbi:WD40/YVTN/BNR-like repeat-containing protein [Saccharospirillum mangrovi]|uniref:WD40/YVTN/BNR-like repeat-containing protein n=1 Tax=Saccharospirillum mangrovi TaxID=2161747 RepID=UPI000D339754|nr:sialidase family protein [Saccharospirillum mangrovi]
MVDRILFWTRKGLVEMRAGDHGFDYAQTHFLGEPVSAAAVGPDGTWWCALALGHFGSKLHRSTDLGANWQEVAVPVFPEKPDDPDDKNPWALEQIWCLEPDPQIPGRLWAGTIPGGLFRSDDGGDSWSLNQALWNVPARKNWFGGGFDNPGLHSIAIHPEDSDSLTVAISSGGVWKSEDAGNHWRQVGKGLRAEYMPEDMQFDLVNQDVHRLMAAPSNPDWVWVQHHNGVFVSSDGAETFRECTPDPSAFGFAVAVHPKRPETAWFVPGVKDQYRFPVDQALLVTRSEDGGKTFQAQRQGLPQGGSFDLVYRHGLAVDRTGNTLAFGTTTGNAWCSRDGGTSWQLLSHTLPPVYGVSLINA